MKPIVTIIKREISDVVTGHKVSSTVIQQSRTLLTADLCGMGTAGVEAASGRRIDRTWDLSAKQLPLPAAQMWVRMGNRIQQKLSVRMQGTGIELLLRRDLADSPQEHHHDPVRDKVNHREVVSDKEARQSHFPFEMLQKMQDLALYGYVQG